MRYTAKHYYPIRNIEKNLLDKEALDKSKLEETSPFYIPENRTAWLEKGFKKPWLPRQAQDIINLANKINLSKIISFGVGGAWLEYNIKKIEPLLYLVCSDCTPQAIARLKKIFTECDEIKEFDIKNSSWSSENALYLFYRVDTDLSNKEWKQVFANMNKSNIRYILFVPSLILNPKIWLQEKIAFLRCKIKKKPISFAGYIRTKDTLRSLFRPYYRIKEEVFIGDLTGFFLEKNI